MALSATSERRKYALGRFDFMLRRQLVASAIAQVDESDTKTIENPYGSQATANVQAVAGTYTPATVNTNDDTLTITDEIIASEHIYRHEEIFAQFDLASSRIDEMMYAVKDALDKYALNVFTAGAGQTYATPMGGFSAGNVPTIFANLVGKVSGYADRAKGMFIVIEDTEVPGLIEAQATAGYNYADSALKNGLIGNYMGVEIYVTRSGTFIDGTMGTQTFTNADNRLFGVKKVMTFASPRGVSYTEKEVSGKTGMEIVVHALVGAKVWATKANLLVNITITP